MTFEEFLKEWKNVETGDHPSMLFSDDRCTLMITTFGERHIEGARITRHVGFSSEPVETVNVKCCFDHMLEETQRRAYAVFMAMTAPTGRPNPKSPWAQGD